MTLKETQSYPIDIMTILLYSVAMLRNMILSIEKFGSYLYHPK